MGSTGRAVAPGLHGRKARGRPPGADATFLQAGSNAHRHLRVARDCCSVGEAQRDHARANAVDATDRRRTRTAHATPHGASELRALHAPECRSGLAVGCETAVLWERREGSRRAVRRLLPTSALPPADCAASVPGVQRPLAVRSVRASTCSGACTPRGSSSAGRTSMRGMPAPVQGGRFEGSRSRLPRRPRPRRLLVPGKCLVDLGGRTSEVRIAPVAERKAVRVLRLPP